MEKLMFIKGNAAELLVDIIRFTEKHGINISKIMLEFEEVDKDEIIKAVLHIQ